MTEKLDAFPVSLNRRIAGSVAAFPSRGGSPQKPTARSPGAPRKEAGVGSRVDRRCRHVLGAVRGPYMRTRPGSCQI